MKKFVKVLGMMSTLALSSVVLADAKSLVITGRVVELSEQNITVESGKKRVEINYSDVKATGNPKVGDTVTVHYTTGHHIYRADPDNLATKMEVKAAADSKK